jgi:integrase
MEVDMARKRGQGEGTISRRKSGLWTAQVSVQGHRQSKYFKARREAQEWVDEMRSQIKAGLTFRGAQMSVAEFLDQWLGSIRASVRLHTLEQYRQIARQHIAPRLGQIKLKDLRPDQIQALYNAKLDSGRSPRTVLMIHAVLRRSLGQALRQGIISRNPAQAVTRPKVRRKEMKVLTDDQARAFLSAAADTRYDVLFYLALQTGMRESELLGLKWCDVDWASRHLHVQRQLQRVPRRGLTYAEPKSAAGRRLIALSPTGITRLRQQLARLDEYRSLAGEKWQENDLIFPTRLGTPMHPTSMTKDFKLVLAKAGLPNIRFHDLRHTAATLMLQQNVHPKVVQERLGHADISLTLNTYSHVMHGMQEEAAAKLDEVLIPVDVSDELRANAEIEPIERQ